MKTLLGFVLLATLWAPFVHAQPEPPTATPVTTNPWHDSGDYRVHFSTFTSDFLPANAARALGFTRAKDRIIVNVALTQKQADGHFTLGLPAGVEGAATNLMQQRKSLSFKPVEEPNATYYLAELRFTNEEVMHFALTVTTPDGTAIDVSFSRKLYVNDQ
ncbi:DUF4426 domain-containing protein [Simiduia sp. 21SJ11W-1]|uniref:DUF4426 domain-containing protein n=1 Tax=Simiduia sp. 21SJ11W-1 TaxID=2909669 RepID=UPI00209D01EE|nr:DUF4426 domain-containing protein [Simiduia sp. 21SJ11W-1]UTA48216.1 DUF4426 domain-containing protein [Simiduia sp. 21SJ11W-1]